MNSVLHMADLDVQVVRKDIKNVHLSVLPPDGAVRVSAPERLTDDVLKAFILSKLGWVRHQQTSLEGQSRETMREYLYLESHYVWGDRYLLELEPYARRHEVVLRPRKMTVRLWGAYSPEKCERVLHAWYRRQVRDQIDKLLPVWASRIGVSPKQIFVQRMKTRWGGCNHHARNIRLNSELGKKPVECLEYILVHELIHLLEPTHNERFLGLMRQYMPTWKTRKNLLNSLPLSHEDWSY